MILGKETLKWSRRTAYAFACVFAVLAATHLGRGDYVLGALSCLFSACFVWVARINKE